MEMGAFNENGSLYGSRMIIKASGSDGIKGDFEKIAANELQSATTMAGVAGFEPTMRESKSRALPLGDTPIKKWGG